MKTTTLIKRAAAKLEKQMLKDGCTDAQVNQCCLCGGSGHNSNTCPWSKG